MNLGDPDLELIDPTPNVHTLFLHFDKIFFWTKLGSRAVVRWSKRMYSCAGVCSYEGRGGLCDIALSEPLLKLRPRKDLIETLLHEMIHAYLFVTNRDQDRDGHGPNFKSHMHRINKSAGLNISIYHSFHDEVKLYQTHWWRCNGPCQTRKPHFGIVRRSANRAPGPYDYWWDDHKRKCGGTFVKIKEPEKKIPVKKKTNTAKPNADITKYITNNILTKPVLKDSNNIPVKTKPNSSSTVLVSKKGVVYNPTAVKPPIQQIPVFKGTGNIISPLRNRSSSVDVAQTVRNIWANKQITSTNKEPIRSNTKIQGPKNPETKTLVSNPNKHKTEPVNIKSPPAKIKKIDDYFKTAATSLLKDLYGDNISLKLTNDDTKLVAICTDVELVGCPVCNAKFSTDMINTHLDECLNKEVIEKLTQNGEIIETFPEVTPNSTDINVKTLKDKSENEIFAKPKAEPSETDINNIIDLTYINVDNFSKANNNKRRKTVTDITFKDLTVVASTSKTQHINNFDRNSNLRRSDSFITKTRGDTFNKGKIETNNNEVAITNTDTKLGSTNELLSQICPCCANKITKPVEEHLEECLAFFDNNTTIPEEGASTSFGNITTMIIDDEDDKFDESIIFNNTGTKTPCPCCLEMVEQVDMNDHLDACLQ